MERVPHGDIPFLGTAESIRHELFLQVQTLSMLHINVLLPPHCCMENRRSHLDYPGANASCCGRGLQVHPRVVRLPSSEV